MPRYPECWKSCGSCASGDVFVLEVHVKPGDKIAKDDNILTLETGKVALDIPSTLAGIVSEVYVSMGDSLDENQALVRIEQHL